MEAKIYVEGFKIRWLSCGITSNASDLTVAFRTTVFHSYSNSTIVFRLISHMLRSHSKVLWVSLDWKHNSNLFQSFYFIHNVVEHPENSIMFVLPKHSHLLNLMAQMIHWSPTALLTLPSLTFVFSLMHCSLPDSLVLFISLVFFSIVFILTSFIPLPFPC